MSECVCVCVFMWVLPARCAVCARRACMRMCPLERSTARCIDDEVRAGSRSRTSRLLLALGALHVGVTGEVHIHGNLIARRAVQLHGAELLRRKQSGGEDTLADGGAPFRRRMAVGKTCEEMSVV